MATFVQTVTFATYEDGASPSTTAFTDVSDAPFTSTKVTNFPNVGIVGAGVAGADYHGTISAFVSSTAVTLATATSTTVTTAPWAWGNASCDTNAAQSTFSFTFTNAINKGDGLWVFFGSDVGLSPTISDTSGNQWILAESNTLAGFGDQHCWVCQNAKAAGAGTNTVTINAGATTSGFSEVVAYNFRPKTEFQFQLDTGTAKSGTSTTGTAVSTSNFSTSFPSEVLVSYIEVDSHVTAGGAGYTVSPNSTYGNASQYEIVTTIQTNVAATATQNSSGNWSIISVGMAEIPNTNALYYGAD